jgi:hypothetical protein
MRKKPSWRIFEIFLLLVSCTGESGPYCLSTTFCLSPQMFTKASDPDPVLISDYNLLIYNGCGVLEESVWVPEREAGEMASYSTVLLSGGSYTVMAAANLGYALGNLTMDQALELRHHLAYPDEYSHGIPMAAVVRDVPSGDVVRIPLERLMAAIDVSLDLSMLDPDVRLTPVEVRIGKCPQAARLFSPGRAERFFTGGFVRSGRDLDDLNRGGKVRLYMLENLSGDRPSSYIEMKSAYHGNGGHSKPEEYLVYRFYLGGEGSFDIARNTLCSFVVRPVGDGLSAEDGWRVDRSGVD